MASQFDIIAIISPKAGKVDRVVELLREVADFIKKNEPGTLRYEITQETNKKSGVEEVIMLETYKDMGALKAHAGSTAFQAMQKKLKEEDLLAGQMQIKFVKPVGGFVSRL